MNAKERLILIELMNHEYVPAQNLAYAIQMSTRSLNSIIKNISLHIKGAEICSGTFGYKLVIRDQEVFLTYLQQGDRLSDEEYRCQYLFERFMRDEGYVRIEDLCEELHLSRTTIKQALREVRACFEEYGVVIHTRPHHGMCLRGTEVNKRRAMAHFRYLKKDQPAVDKIRDIVVSSMANMDTGDFQVSDDGLDGLVVYLYIACERVGRGCYIDIEDGWGEEAEKEREYGLGRAVMTLMNQVMGMEYREEETAYLTIYLCGINIAHEAGRAASWAGERAGILVDQEIFDIVNDMMRLLEGEVDISFSTDLNLQLSLSLHMVSLARRIKYRTYMRNPLLEDIKTRLIAAYELSIRLSEFINERFECELPEDETGYLALYINLSLEQELNKIQKKRILLVCSSGVGSGKLLEYYFEENFKAYIQKITVCSRLDMEKEDVSQYDCVFSTIPLKRELPIPVFVIGHFVDRGDTGNIARKFKALNEFDPRIYFPKELFFVFDSFKNKEEAIHQIVRKCHLHYKLPEEFEALILERERLGSTEFHGLAAFPHAYKPVADTTFVSVTVLKKPMVWKKAQIRLIFLSSIENKVNKNLDIFYKVISVLLGDIAVQMQILKDPVYDNFASVIERIEV